MQFSVPQFIEHEGKILGPLTFKQFIFIGGAGAICFVIYLLLPFSLFLIITVILVGAGTALAFLKIGGKSLPMFMISAIKFTFESKIYVWKKKEQQIMIYKKTEKPFLVKEEKKQEPTLKIAEKSRLKKMYNKIEIKTK